MMEPITRPWSDPLMRMDSHRGVRYTPVRLGGSIITYLQHREDTFQQAKNN